MENAAFPRSLTILTRSGEENESQSRFARRASGLSADEYWTSGAPSPASSSRRSRSQASTPPPDDEAPTQAQLINGIGGHFPAAFQTRASSLTVGSESASHVSDAVRRSQTPEVKWSAAEEECLLTPKASKRDWNRGSDLSPVNTALAGSCTTVQVNPLTPSPSPLRAKRGASPPSTPRPTKMSRPNDWRLPPGLPLKNDMERRSGGSTLPRLADVVDLTTSIAGSLPRRESDHSDDSNDSGYSDNDDPSSVLAFMRADGVLERAQPLPTGDGYSVQDQHQVGIKIEWFSEDQIEAQLSAHLAPDGPSAGGPESLPGPQRTRLVRLFFFRGIFQNQLKSAKEDELLQQEDEDVMSLFMSWVRELRIPSSPRTEMFADIHEGMNRLQYLGSGTGPGNQDATWPFIRKIILLPDNQSSNTYVSGTTFRGVNASIMGDGSTVWEFASIHCRPGQSPIPSE